MAMARSSTTPRCSAAPTRAPERRSAAGGLLAVVLVLLVSVSAAGCSSGPSDQRRLNTVMVGAPETLSEADSEAVSAIGLELVALAAPLEDWFAGARPRDELLDEMTDAVERIEGRLTPERAPAVRSTFEPYVAAWHRILEALARDDLDDYDDAVARIRELDDRRIARVVEALGDEAARDLLESEADTAGGTAPNR
jgi:hypothetical protein